MMVTNEIKHITYNGCFDNSHLEDMSTNINNVFKTYSSVFQKKIFSIFIEIVQNVTYHSDEYCNTSKGDRRGIGYFEFQETEDSFVFLTKNKAKREKCQKLITYCEQINKFEREDLRAYKRERRQLTPKKNGCANFGLIQIALLSNQPIIIENSQLNESFDFVTIKVALPKE